jgi:mycofactocin precursor
MPDTIPPINEAPAAESPAATEGTPTTPETQETSETISVQPETPLEVEIEEELIIEDFTIDGICGVY